MADVAIYMKKASAVELPAGNVTRFVLQGIPAVPLHAPVIHYRGGGRHVQRTQMSVRVHNNKGAPRHTQRVPRAHASRKHAPSGCPSLAARACARLRLESRKRVGPRFLDAQREVNPEMRGVLVDWIVGVHRTSPLPSSLAWGRGRPM